MRLIAISCAGAFLRINKNKELVRLLLDIFEKNNQSEFGQGETYEELLREVAYEALASAIGVPFSEVQENGFEERVISKAHPVKKCTTSSPF